MKLRELAKEWPACDYCGLANPNNDLLVMCHSNALEDGRGYAFKSRAIWSAFGCQRCHDLVDGRSGHMDKLAKREMHFEANKKMLRRLLNQAESINLKDGRTISLEN